jgi:hypothetical protein
MGSAQLLENGNVLVGWGNGSPKITEFKPDGSKAMELGFEGLHYRVYRMPWEPAAFTFSENKLDFGKVVIGETDQMDLGITNNMSRSIEINHVVIFEDQFEVPQGQLPLILESDESGWITIFFTPSDTGSFSDMVTFCYDTEQTGMNRRIGKQILFSGTGTDDLGLNENDPALARIYPNPGNGMINIESDNIFSRIIVKDLKGTRVKNLEFKPANKRTFSLEGLPKATYILELSGKDNFTQTLKYIKTD